MPGEKEKSPRDQTAGNPWANAEDKSGDLLQDPEKTAREKAEVNLGRKQAGTGSGAPRDKAGDEKGIGASTRHPTGGRKSKRA